MLSYYFFVCFCQVFVIEMVAFSGMKMSVSAILLAALSGATEGVYPTAEEFRHLELLNKVRAEGYQCWSKYYPPNPVPLKWNCALWKAARDHSTDMADNDYFSHTGLDGSHPQDRVSKYGASFSYENIASGYDDAVRSLQQWLDSGLGHCNGMMDPNNLSMGVGHAVHFSSSYWHYWTQLMSHDDVDSEKQDCVNEDGGIPAPIPTPPPTNYPTLAGDAAPRDELMNFQPTSWEMEFIRLMNEERARGTRGDCHGDTYAPGELEPLVWNCPLFKAGRHHIHDNLVHDDYNRVGSDGKKLSDRTSDYGIPYTCADFKLKEDSESGYWSSPERLVQRVASLACWAVYGPEYKTLAVVYAKRDEPNSQFPHHAYYIMFDRFTPSAELQQSCGKPQPLTPVPQPTPAPTPAPTDSPTAVPTLAPSPAPSMTPVIDPTSPPAEFSCAEIVVKKDCKKSDECAWKKTCKDKSKVCPKQKTEEKCTKFGCVWVADAEICG